LGSVEQSTTSLLRPLDDDGSSNFSASTSFLAEVAGQYCSGHVCGPVGDDVGDFVGSLDGAAVGAFVGEEVGEEVTGQGKDVSHCVFVVLPPSHVPRLPGFPLFGKHWLSSVQELPELVLFAEHVP
jgi:hypothetical protein